MKYDYTDLLENLYGQCFSGNRIRMLVSKTQIQVPGSPLNVTVSMGATMAAPDDTRDSLMKRADMLLYKSKNKGKNCITIE